MPEDTAPRPEANPKQVAGISDDQLTEVFGEDSDDIFVAAHMVMAVAE
jgi:hypothetical protein